MLIALPKCDNLVVQLLPQQFTLLQSHSRWSPVAHLGEFILNIDFAKPEWDYFYPCMSWLWTTYSVLHISKSLEVHEEEILEADLGALTQFQSYRYQEEKVVQVPIPQDHLKIEKPS